MVYRAEILQRTGAALHVAYGVVAAVVLAIADPDPNWTGAVFALVSGLIFYYVVARFAVAKNTCEPVPAASGTRLASERETRRRAVRSSLAEGGFNAALLAGMFAIGQPFWVLPGILLGAAAAQMRSAQRARGDAARVPGTFRVMAPAQSGIRTPLLWRSEWGDVAP